MKKVVSILALVCFLFTGQMGTYPVYGSTSLTTGAQEFRLPAPGVRVNLSPEFNPPILKGLKVHPDNPFRFDFILDQGDNSLPLVGRAREGEIKQQATRLIKYFLASLTIPEKDLWVNLSPYEKNRIVPESFGQTEMGRDLLAEDYMLKQITASLIYPEDEIGKKFWKRIYEEAAKKFGTTNIPVNTFNKVWIVPEKAVVYENAKAGTAYVVEAKLKVMLEQDYLALSKNSPLPNPPHKGEGNLVNIFYNSPHKGEGNTNLDSPPLAGGVRGGGINALGSQIVREIVIPELTKEVNEGKNFAQLRQVYNSLILATWYKKKIKDSILAQVFEDKNKVLGLSPTRGHVQDRTTKNVSPSQLPINEAMNVKATQRNEPNDVELIYQRYLQAFKKGVYNYIKEEPDPITQEVMPRKYFSGGVDWAMFGNEAGKALRFTTDGSKIHSLSNSTFVVNMNVHPLDMAMRSKVAIPRRIQSLYDKFIRYQVKPMWLEHFAYDLAVHESIKERARGNVLYLGSGTDITHVIVTTNGKEFDMVDQFVSSYEEFINYDWDKHLDTEKNYLRSKKGWGYIQYLWMRDNFSTCLVAELKSLGISKDKLKVSRINGGFRIIFEKRFPGEAKAQEYTFNFIKGYTATFKPDKQYDILFQKAGWTPWRYGARDVQDILSSNVIIRMNPYMKQGAFIVMNPYDLDREGNEIYKGDIVDLIKGRGLQYQPVSLPPFALLLEKGLSNLYEGRQGYPGRQGYGFRLMVFRNVRAGAAMNSSDRGGQLSDKDFLTTNGLLLTTYERNDLPDRVNRKSLPEQKKIIVLENTPHQAEAYAGNLIQALRDKKNMVRVLSMAAADNFETLVDESPDLVLIQDNDQNMEELLRTYAGWIEADIPVLYYPNLDHPKETLGARPLTIRPNLSVPGDYIKTAQKAIKAHQSQYPREEFPYRRPYDKVAYFTSQAMARIARYLGFNAEEGDYANNLVVVEMDQNGKWLEPDAAVKYQLTDGGSVKEGFLPVKVREGMKVVVISPHADDPEIALFNVIIRSLLQGADVENFIYSTGRNGVDSDDPLLKEFMKERGIPNEKIDEAKILLREQEAGRAAEILQSIPGIKGKMHVKPLRVDMVLDDNKKRESMITALEPLVKEHKERFPDLPVVVSLPHLVDEHKTHQEATKYTLEALAELARRYEVKIQLLFYLAPWSGDYNTYFHYSRSKQSAVSGEHKEIQDILDPLSQGFAYNTSSLTGGHGQRSLSPQAMGGEFVERFRRAVVSPVMEQVAKMGDEDQAMDAEQIRLLEAIENAYKEKYAELDERMKFPGFPDEFNYTEAGYFTPTDIKVAAQLLAMAGVGKQTVFVDAGGGDGRVPLVASSIFGAQGIAIEKNKDLISLAKEMADKLGESKKVKFIQGWIKDYDFSKADVVYYTYNEPYDIKTYDEDFKLGSKSNFERFERQIAHQLKPEAVVILTFGPQDLKFDSRFFDEFTPAQLPSNLSIHPRFFRRKLRGSAPSAGKQPGDRAMAVKTLITDEQMKQMLMDAYNSNEEKTIVSLTDWLRDRDLLEGKIKAKFVLPNGNVWGKQQYMKVGTGLTGANVEVHKKDGKVLGIMFVGIGFQGKEKGRSWWQWDGERFNFQYQEDTEITKQLRDAYTNDQDEVEIDLTDWLGTRGLKYGTMKASFILPNGKTWGKHQYMRIGTKLTFVNVVIHKKKGKVLGMTLIGYKGAQESGRSEWEWDGQKFNYKSTKTTQKLNVIDQLKDAYTNDKDEVEIDLTDWLGSYRWTGVMGPTFLLPNGKTWGKIQGNLEFMRIGSKLTQVKVVVHKKKGKVLGLTLIGYRDKEEYRRSYWQWDGEQFNFQWSKRGVGLAMQQLKEAYTNDQDEVEIDLTDWLKSYLLSGRLKASFILPNGEVWGVAKYMKIGYFLKRVKIVIHKKGGIVAGITLIGTNIKGRIRKSEWAWDGEKFNYIKPKGSEDSAMDANGGIDLTPANMNLQTKMDSRFHGNDKGSNGNDNRNGGDDKGIQFYIDPAMLRQLQNAPGFVPVIINIQPLNDLRLFLGISEKAGNLPGAG